MARKFRKSMLSEFAFHKTSNWTEKFRSFDVDNYDHWLRTTKATDIEQAGKRRALEVFHEAARRVPAYKKFLKSRKVNPRSIKTWSDFTRIPITDKENYTSKYPLSERCWDGKLSQSSLVAVSSGMSGEPKFWPRGGYQEFEAGVLHELIYKKLFQVDKYKTLLVIGFPMGVYVSGIATVLPSWLVTQKGYPLTLATVGNNRDEAIRVVKNLKKDYEQIVLVGHPFFLKDVLETGKDKGVRWSDKRLRLMMCSEGFSEQWREYLAKTAGIKNPSQALINTYGSSEMELMATETPFTINIRKSLSRNTKLSQEIFQTSVLPNIFQYNPILRYIESIDDELVFTSASGLPLIRYNLKDSGKVIGYDEMEKIISSKSKGNWHLPFVSLNGRSDYTVIFYAANIYPSHISAGLNHKSLIGKLTGKFTMVKGYHKKMDEYLDIHVEMRPDVKAGKKLEIFVSQAIVRGLKHVNMEYLDQSLKGNKNLIPRIKLHTYQSGEYFKPGLKPRFIRTS